VRTKFCDECAAVVAKWLSGEKTIESPPENTFSVALDRPLTPAEGEQVTRHETRFETKRELIGLCKQRPLETNREFAERIVRESHEYQAKQNTARSKTE
jgi:hypothetical protein